MRVCLLDNISHRVIPLVPSWIVLSTPVSPRAQYPTPMSSLMLGAAFSLRYFFSRLFLPHGPVTTFISPMGISWLCSLKILLWSSWDVYVVVHIFL